jgi:hypothetical protein
LTDLHALRAFATRLGGDAPRARAYVEGNFLASTQGIPGKAHAELLRTRGFVIPGRGCGAAVALEAGRHSGNSASRPACFLRQKSARRSVYPLEAAALEQLAAAGDRLLMISTHKGQDAHVTSDRL